MSWLITGTEKTPVEALEYLRLVELADGQALESGVRDAVIAFVAGCKNDGIWSAIKASCILAGARTLSGALVPLVGAAPTNFNFVQGDYARKTGLVGDGSTKYLETGYKDSDDPVSNCSSSINGSGFANTQQGLLVAGLNYRGISTRANNLGITIHSRNSSVTLGLARLPGFAGESRQNPTEFIRRYQQVSTTAISSEGTPSNLTFKLFVLEGANYATARLSFYHIGESLNLALLDARVTTLINAIAAAIP
jgi:hypothetical protein